MAQAGKRSDGAGMGSAGAGTLLVLLAAGLWGSNGLFVAAFEGYGLAGTQYTAVKLSSAAIGAFICELVKNHGHMVRVGAKDILWLAINGFVGAFLFSLLYNVSTAYTNMATAAVLIYLMPCLVMAWSVLRGEERLTGRKVLCLILSLSACALVSGIFSSGIEGSLVGVLAGLASAVCYAVNNIIQAGPLKRLPTFTVVFYTALFGAMGGVIYAAATDGFATAVAIYMAQPSALALNILYGALCTLIAFMLYNTALRLIPVSQASILATFEPVAAAIFGALFLGEAFTPEVVAGIVCEVVSLVMLQTGPQESLEEPRSA